MTDCGPTIETILAETLCLEAGMATRQRGRGIQPSDLVRVVGVPLVRRGWPPAEGPAPKGSEPLAAPLVETARRVALAATPSLARARTAGDRLLRRARVELAALGRDVTESEMSEAAATMLAETHRAPARIAADGSPPSEQTRTHRTPIRWGTADADRLAPPPARRPLRRTRRSDGPCRLRRRGREPLRRPVATAGRGEPAPPSAEPALSRPRRATPARRGAPAARPRDPDTSLTGATGRRGPTAASTAATSSPTTGGRGPARPGRDGMPARPTPAPARRIRSGGRWSGPARPTACSTRSTAPSCGPSSRPCPTSTRCRTARAPSPWTGTTNAAPFPTTSSRPRTAIQDRVDALFARWWRGSDRRALERWHGPLGGLLEIGDEPRDP